MNIDWKKSCLILLIIYVFYRIVVLVCFNFEYTDHDQLTMWYATASFAHLDFWQPRWFGGNKNAMIESFLAVPLYLVGIKLKYALPIATFLFSITPFFLLVYNSYKNNEFKKAVIILVYLSFMGFNYDLLSSAPRSFVSGLALMSISLFLLFKRRYLFLSGFLIPIAAMATATSGIFIFFFALYFTAKFVFSRDEYKNIFSDFIRSNVSDLMFFVIGLIIGIFVYYYSAVYFFESVCKECSASDLYFNIYLSNFITNIQAFDESFKNFSIISSGFITVLIFLFAMVISYIKKNYLSLFIWLMTAGFSFCLYAFSKVNDYSENSFYLPQFRLFMYVPILIALAFYLTYHEQTKNKTYVLLMSFSVFLISIFYKVYNLSSIKNNNFYSTVCNVVPYKIIDLEEKLSLIYAQEKNDNNHYVVFTNLLDTGYVYAINSLYYNSFFSHMLNNGFAIFSRQIKDQIRKKNVCSISVYGHDGERKFIKLRRCNLKRWLKNNSAFGDMIEQKFVSPKN